MSLKAVHICIILLSIVLALGFGFWATKWNQAYFVLGIVSYGLGVILTAYLGWFLIKTRGLKPPS